jgi:hypothetical protein
MTIYDIWLETFSFQRALTDYTTTELMPRAA